MTTHSPKLCREDVGDDEPLRLDVAARLAFPDGSMTASGLRREASKGRLAVEIIANKAYTTLNAIRHMRAICRVEARVPASGSSQRDGKTKRSSSRRSGASATADSNEALVAARATLKVLKVSSATTSPANTEHRGPASVIPLPSKSPT